jgi:hypothetical protein
VNDAGLGVDTSSASEFRRSSMKPLGIGGLIAILIAIMIVKADNSLPSESSNVLPEALSDDFQFRKFKIFRNALPTASATPILTKDLMIDFERRRRVWGAINDYERKQLTGQYFTFAWRAKRRANLTLRLEYRQVNLKNYVQARELNYPSAKGSYTSEIAILGEDYEQDGPITSWRAILIEDQKIVGLLQSRTWR